MFVLYDSDCGFCRWSVFKAAHRAPTLTPVAIQSDEGQRLLEPIDEQKRLTSAHTVGFGGVHSGGEAIIDVLGELPSANALYKAARAMPTFTDLIYKLIASQRRLLGRFIPARARERADAYLDVRSSTDPRSGPGSQPSP